MLTYLRHQSTGLESALFARQDGEVVVGRVPAAVAFCSDRRTEEDEVLEGTESAVCIDAADSKRAYLGDAGVDDVHGTHGACDNPMSQQKVQARRRAAYASRDVCILLSSRIARR